MTTIAFLSGLINNRKPACNSRQSLAVKSHPVCRSSGHKHTNPHTTCLPSSNFYRASICMCVEAPNAAVCVTNGGINIIRSLASLLFYFVVFLAPRVDKRRFIPNFDSSTAFGVARLCTTHGRAASDISLMECARSPRV
jgi:hypothetical protein